MTLRTFDLWRHNWGHVRRKMRSVQHATWSITCKHRRFCQWYECGHLVPSSTHAFDRSSGPTQVNRGQMRSNVANELCRLFRVLLPSKVIWGADFDSDIHFALRRLEMRSWNHQAIKGQWRHMTQKRFFEFLAPKNHPWAFKNQPNMFYSSHGTRRSAMPRGNNCDWFGWATMSSIRSMWKADAVMFALATGTKTVKIWCHSCTLWAASPKYVFTGCD